MIAVVNQSDQISNADAALAVRAVAAQANDAAVRWRQFQEATIFYASVEHVPPGTKTITIMRDADQAGVLGWHDEENGVPMGRVFTDPIFSNGGSALSGPYSVSATLSHERLELGFDPYTQLYAVNYNDGKLYAVEVGDPVENDSYDVTLHDRDGSTHTVAVSNYVLPGFFDYSGFNKPFDRLGKLKAPFTMTSGGYMIVVSIGNEGQVTAETLYGKDYPEWKKPLKEQYGRTARRVNTRLNV